MGRGLSDLQKNILAMAAEGPVRHHEVVHRLYGIPYADPAAAVTVHHRSGRAYKVAPQYRWFRDTPEARRAKAAVSRALRRLLDRGLMAWRRATITYPSGYAYASGLEYVLAPTAGADGGPD